MQRGGVWLAIAAVHLGLLQLASRWSPAAAKIFPAPAIEARLLFQPDEPLPAPEPPAPELVSITPALADPPVIDLHVAPQAAASTAIFLPAASPSPSSPPAPRAMPPPLVSEVQYVEPPVPRYPRESRRRREEGLVLLRVLVGEDGRARRIDVHRSSGHPRLDEAARAAVERAIFRPFVEGGMPRAALVMIPIEFGLRIRRASARH